MTNVLQCHALLSIMWVYYDNSIIHIHVGGQINSFIDMEWYFNVDSLSVAIYQYSLQFSVFVTGLLVRRVRLGAILISK